MSKSYKFEIAVGLEIESESTHPLIRGLAAKKKLTLLIDLVAIATEFSSKRRVLNNNYLLQKFWSEDELCLIRGVLFEERFPTVLQKG